MKSIILTVSLWKHIHNVRRQPQFGKFAGLLVFKHCQKHISLAILLLRVCKSRGWFLTENSELSDYIVHNQNPLHWVWYILVLDNSIPEKRHCRYQCVDYDALVILNNAQTMQIYSENATLSMCLPSRIPSHTSAQKWTQQKYFLHVVIFPNEQQHTQIDHNQLWCGISLLDIMQGIFK